MHNYTLEKMSPESEVPPHVPPSYLRDLLCFSRGNLWCLCYLTGYYRGKLVFLCFCMEANATQSFTGTDYCRKVSCGYLTRVVISLSFDLCRDCSKVDDNGQSDIKRCDLSPARRHAHRCGVSDGITAALVMKLEWNREIMWKMCCGLWEYTTVCVPKHLLKNK